MLHRITEHVAVAGRRDALPEYLRDHGADLLVWLDGDEPPAGAEEACRVLHLPLPDGVRISGLLLEAVDDAARDAALGDRRTVIAGGVGCSRAPAVALFHLLREGVPPERALLWLRATCPDAAPHPVLVASALSACGLPVHPVALRRLLAEGRAPEHDATFDRLAWYWPCA